MAVARKILMGLLIALAAAIAGVVVLQIILAWISRRNTPELGVTEGMLQPCPNSPNCVCSQAEDPRHAIAPIAYTTSLTEARTTLLNVIAELDDATIVTQDPTYIRVEVYVRGFGFIDDVEFVFDEEAQVIHFRSSSRVPYYDFELNRKRMEGVRAAFEAASN
jgi:uncharacterized protein (DUF1499 family)